MVEDITERKLAAELIEHQATFDDLTDLPNRRLLLDRLTQAMARCRRHGQLGAALYIDLDNFKHINDSLGHPSPVSNFDAYRSNDRIARQQQPTDRQFNRQGQGEGLKPIGKVI